VVIVAYDEEDVGLQSVRDAISLVRAALGGPPFDAEASTRELQDLYERVRLGPSTWAIVEEARRRGIPVRRLNSRSLVQLGLGRNLRRIQATLTDHTSAIAIEIAQDKDDTKRVLEARPARAGRRRGRIGRAGRRWRRRSTPVIPAADLSHGRSAAPSDEAAVRAARARGSQTPTALS
jgi:cyanophycin synthetase